VLDGDPAPPQGKGHSSRYFSAHVYCGQTVAHLSNCWAFFKVSFGSTYVTRGQRHVSKHCNVCTLENVIFITANYVACLPAWV